MKITNLQINHLTIPVGISGKNIRVSWNLEGGKKQTACQVKAVISDGTVIEDSGKLASGDMVYKFKTTLPWRSETVVSVIVWDEDDKASDPAEIRVVTGIEKTAWQAEWINPETAESDFKKKPDKGNRRPAAYLKKTFTASDFKRAMLYVTAHGLVNVYINGEVATDLQLMPGTQQYNKRLMVETLDVTPYVKAGENEILVTLGDGWYRGPMGYDQYINVFGTDIALLAQLELDGEAAVVTDETWQASNNGPLGFNDFMNGEEYNALRSETMTWHGVDIADFGTDNLIPVDTQPILRHESFKAKLITTPKGEKVLDFGQNLVGYVEFSFDAKAGDKLTLIHGESLDKDGNFTIEHFQNGSGKGIRTEQTIRYTCKNGRNTYYPTKIYMGFRYVKVDADFDIDPDAFTAYAIYSDMRETAHFECGLPEINQLFKNAMWSMKGNFVDVPTDCPTREKSGYSGDAQAYTFTAMYMMDCYPVLAKWIREQAATQFKDGCVAQVAPSCVPGQKKGGTDGGIGWSDSFTIIPYKLMKQYNDSDLVEEVFEGMVRWTKYRQRQACKTKLVNVNKIPRKYRHYKIDSGWMWGEWLEPDQAAGMEGLTKYMKELMLYGDMEDGTAYLGYGVQIMSEMADRIGETGKAMDYRIYAETVREAYHALFLPNGRIEEPKRQCRYVRPVALGMLTEEEKQQTVDHLAEMVKANGNKLNTGFLTTNELSRTLSNYGHADTAYDLLLQKESPSWLYSVTKGATTILENWNGIKEDGTPVDSHNHYSYGAIMGWIFDSACGIRLNDGKITIKPCTDARIGYMTATYDSPLGTITSGWKYDEDGKVSYHFVIPANNTATVILPDGVHELEAGEYDF